MPRSAEELPEPAEPRPEVPPWLGKYAASIADFLNSIPPGHQFGPLGLPLGLAQMGAAVGRRFGQPALGASPELVRQIRMIRRSLGPAPKLSEIIPGLESRMAIAPAELEAGLIKEAVEKTVRGPFFHGAGTPERAQQILQQGFDPARVGANLGMRLGEPAGVSLTASPDVASSMFGPNLLRVFPNVQPSQVLPAFTKEAYDPLRSAYIKALQGVTLSSEELKNLPRFKGAKDVPLADVIAEFKSAAKSEDEFKQLTAFGIPKPVMSRFNQIISDELQKMGFEGVMYSPRRYREFEMRVLDPKKAVPLEMREMLPGPAPNLSRYAPLKQSQLEQFYDISPEKPTDLGDIYKSINLREVLGKP